MGKVNKNRKTASSKQKASKPKARKTAASEDDGKVHRRYKVPLRAPSGKEVKPDWNMLSKMLEATTDMPIGEPKFWLEPLAHQLKHVQLSKKNKLKFQEPLKMASRGTNPEGYVKKRGKRSVVHPQGYVYEQRMRVKMNDANKEVRDQMTKEGFKLAKYKKKAKKEEEPKFRDPRTGDIMSREDSSKVVEFAKSEPGSMKPPSFMLDYPGKPSKKRTGTKTKLMSAKSSPSTFIGTPYSKRKREEKKKSKISGMISERLSKDGLLVDKDKHVTTMGRNKYLVPIIVTRKAFSNKKD